MIYGQRTVVCLQHYAEHLVVRPVCVKLHNASDYWEHVARIWIHAWRHYVAHIVCIFDSNNQVWFTVDKIEKNEERIRIDYEYKFHWRDLRQLNWIYWVIVFNCTFMYSGMTFYNFSNDFLKIRYGFTQMEAARINSNYYIVCLIWLCCLATSQTALVCKWPSLLFRRRCWHYATCCSSWYRRQRLKTSHTGHHVRVVDGSLDEHFTVIFYLIETSKLKISFLKILKYI